MDAPLPPDLVPAWEEFLSRPRTLDDLFAHPLLFPLQRRREMEAMFRTWRQGSPDNPEHPIGMTLSSYMEIGADKGGGLWAWLWAFPELQRVVACEIRGTPYAELFEEAFPHVRFLWLPQSSYERAAVDCTRSWLGRHGLDVLFLDGAKDRFRDDWTAYRPMVRPGGTVFLHDITDRGPGDAWRDITARRWTELDGDRLTTSEIHDIGEVGPALDRKESGAALTGHDDWLCIWKGRSCGVGVVHV